MQRALLHFNCDTVLPHRCVPQQAGQMLDRAKLKLAGRKKVVAEVKHRLAQMPACGAGLLGHIPSAAECECKCDPYKLIDSNFIICLSISLSVVSVFKLSFGMCWMIFTFCMPLKRSLKRHEKS